MRKYALITGGSRGIGKAIALKLSENGYSAIINFVSNTEAAQNTLQEIVNAGGDGELLQFDVRDQKAVTDALCAWQHSHENEYISVLINNAGIRKDGLMLWMERKDWEEVIQTSLAGFYNVTQPLLKNMLAKRYGRIVNIASLSGIKGLPGQTNYSAAKGGLIAATKALAQETAKRNVTVNAIAPGFIYSDMTEDLNETEIKKIIPAGRFGKPKEVAALAAFLVSDEAAYITGEVISINGGIYM
jgi:3-oxoacyl-[acyl-carrier protein] reductase